MKKVTMLLFVLISLNVFAQSEKPISKGNFIIDGSGYISYSNTKTIINTNEITRSNTTISLGPSCMYFFVDNLAVGLSTNVTFGWNSSSEHDYGYGIGPKVKYYFNNGIFLKTDFMYLRSKSSSDTKYFTLDSGVGYAFFINPKVSIEPMLAHEFLFSTSDFTEDYKLKSNKIKLAVGITIFI